MVRRPRLQVLVPRVCVFFLWFFLENIKVCEIAARASGQVPQVIDREETVHSCASCWLSSVAFVRHSMLPGKSGLRFARDHMRHTNHVKINPIIRHHIPGWDSVS